MSRRGVWQLKKLVLHYCDKSGSSRGTRQVWCWLNGGSGCCLDAQGFGAALGRGSQASRACGTGGRRLAPSPAHGRPTGLYPLAFQLHCTPQSTRSGGAWVPPAGATHTPSCPLFPNRPPHLPHPAPAPHLLCREFLEHLWPQFRAENPQMRAEAVLRPGRHPFIEASYRESREWWWWF